ncbi:uncharacterized protein LOC129293262 [Prosopis cineraria]|uniref:uncharacterized protein LOC129293262 n=1 Tax=Prosopis cineraria TaxID=364024 RepID=UPI00240FFB7C|nr:uncharacterized protein LOC129293262 [Prosopis cineraria]
MGDNCADTRKRVRDDSSEFDEDLHESKIARVHSDSDVNSGESQLSRTNSVESCDNSEVDELSRVDSATTPLESPAAGGIEDALLNILDDSDNAAERDPTMQGLDSVIKSFEDEILAPGPDPVGSATVHESSDLRHLLEASDDELGLPPTVTPPAEEDKPEPLTEGFSRVGPDGIDLSGFLGFEDDIPQYEAFGYGAGVFVEYGVEDNGSGFVTLDGLFDHADAGDVLWRSESLQAI